MRPGDYGEVHKLRAHRPCRDEGADVGVRDPFQDWSGAPKQWGHVPEQRQCPPEAEQLEDTLRRITMWDHDRRQFGEWSVAAVALAVAVAAFVLIGTGGAVPDHDDPPSERSTSVR
jgi:hypothetical protein